MHITKHYTIKLYNDNNDNSVNNNNNDHNNGNNNNHNDNDTVIIIIIIIIIIQASELVQLINSGPFPSSQKATELSSRVLKKGPSRSLNDCLHTKAMNLQVPDQTCLSCNTFTSIEHYCCLHLGNLASL